MPKANPLLIDFAQEKEAGYQRVFPRAPLLTSLAAGWNGIYFAHDYHLPGETPEVFAKQHGIAIFTEVTTPRQVERTLDGHFQREQVVQGDILVVPANLGHRAQWNEAGGVIYLGFDPTVFAHATYELLDPDRIELIPHFATSDHLIYQIGLALKAVLEKKGTGSRLYAETMANALIVHLLQHYTTQQPILRNDAEGLSRHNLWQVIDYIQAHLDQDLGLTELATVVQMSCHYFSKQFKQSMGVTPHQYIIRTRVERAKQLLKGDLSISDIAHTVGFVDQSHLNRHFKRIFGITPNVMRQK